MARRLFGAALLLVLGLLSAAPPLSGLDRAIMDFVHAVAYPRLGLSDDVTLIVIDERTLEAFDARADHEISYLSPMDRGMLAEIITDIAAGHPAAIGLDVLLDRPTEVAKDAALRSAIAKAPVVLAAVGSAAGDTPEGSAFLKSFASRAEVGHVLFWKTHAGGPVRAAPGQWRTAAGVAPPLAAGLAARKGVDWSGETLTLAYALPKEPLSPLFPMFRGEDVAAIPSDWFRDRIVIIGGVSDGIDRHRLPLLDLDPATPSVASGVEVHAQFVQQILDGRSMRETPLWAKAVAALVAGVAGWWFMLLPVARPVRALASVAVLTGLSASLPVMLATASVRGPAVAMLAAWAAGTVTAGVSQWRAASLQRRRLRRGFEKYLAPSIVAKVASEPDALRLGGERREVTLIFTDVEGFTSAAEASDPERFARVLNAYLDGMSAIIVESGGTIDKFVGDAVVSFFGAPSPRPDHAAAATRAALRLDAFAVLFSAEAQRDGVPFGKTRIGLHTGPAIVGNFGGDRFFDYTAIGDTVNTAARLEAANKELQTRICVSEATATAARVHDRALLFRPIDEIALRGRTKRVRVYEPMEKTASGERDYAAYQAAFAMISCDARGALDAFSALAARDPSDGLAGYWVRRLARELPSRREGNTP